MKSHITNICQKINKKIIYVFELKTIFSTRNYKVHLMKYPEYNFTFTCQKKDFHWPYLGQCIN